MILFFVFLQQERSIGLKVYELPMASRISRGKPIINLSATRERMSQLTQFLPVKEFTDDQFVFMVTSSGTCKKTSLTNFSRPRKGGIIAIELREDDDKLVGVEITAGEHDILLFSSAGKSIQV